MGRPARPEKAPRYEAFVSDVLQRDLWRVQQQREEVYEKITQHMWLKTVIERLQEVGGRAVQTQVDLGYNFFVNADVPDTSRIFVALGYGFFAELTLTEALRFVERKTKLLIELSESLTKDSAKIKANIRMVLEGLRELQGFQDLPEDPRRDIAL
ncbi:LOW QUALITY PROTEIN: protein UXT [Emys orbicularis]